MRGARGPILLALLLAGCGSRAPTTAPPHGAIVTPSATADGSYIGPSRLILADNRRCPKSAVRTVTVFDGGFDLKYRTTDGAPTTVRAIIAPDGTVHAEDVAVMVQGRLEGDALNLTVGNGSCQSHMVLRRR